jgi:hypothetical protein
MMGFTMAVAVSAKHNTLSAWSSLILAGGGSMDLSIDNGINTPKLFFSPLYL